jgi:hypothetical protein
MEIADLITGKIPAVIDLRDEEGLFDTRLVASAFLYQGDLIFIDPDWVGSPTHGAHRLKGPGADTDAGWEFASDDGSITGDYRTAIRFLPEWDSVEAWREFIRANPDSPMAHREMAWDYAKQILDLPPDATPDY